MKQASKTVGFIKKKVRLCQFSLVLANGKICLLLDGLLSLCEMHLSIHTLRASCDQIYWFQFVGVKYRGYGTWTLEFR
jgi:hypothetical protein